MKQLIACCGIDCENCDARIATITNDDELREKSAQKWSVMNNTPDITAATIFKQTTKSLNKDETMIFFTINFV